MKTTFTIFFFHKKGRLKENTFFKSKETVSSFLIVLLKLEKGSQNENCHFFRGEGDQSREADIIITTGESEEVVLTSTGCGIDPKTTVLLFCLVWFYYFGLCLF